MTIKDLWINVHVGFYKWHKIRSYNTAYCGLYIHAGFFPTYMDRSKINESALCKNCVRVIDKRRGV